MAIPIPRRKTSVIAGDFGKLRVERHELEGEPDGALPWFTLGLADWVVIAAVTHDGRFVLVRQHRAGVNDLTLETAGGILEPGEDPAAAALRELREETGWEAPHAEPLGWVHPNPALQSNRCHLFLARGATQVADWQSDPAELTEPVLLTEPQLRAQLTSAGISHALSLLALERALGRLHEAPAFAKMMSLIEEMEDDYRHKVLELARRILPHLTAEDIRNPHDFPDLEDPDWHFQDGQLAGVEAVRFAMARLKNEAEGRGHR